MPRTPALLLLLASVAAAQTPWVRVHVDTPAEAQALAALGLDVAGVPPEVDVYIHGPGDMSALAASGLQHAVVQDDVETWYRSRLDANRPESTTPPFGQGSMGGYFTWTEMVLFMDDLASQNPQIFAPKVSLGTSFEGRDLWMWKVSDNPLVDENEPEFLCDALHHSREPITLQAAVWLAMQLAQGYGTDPEITALVDGREIFIVPAVNPDGYVRNEVTNPGGGGIWRKNRRPNFDGSFGVDLNRNYGFQWGINNVGSSPTPSSETYRGTGPFSEPCTAAMRNFAESRLLRLGFTMHSYGGMIFLPPSYATNAFAPQPLRAQYETIAGELASLPPGWLAGYSWALLLGPAANGVTEDWWYGALYGGQQMWAFACEVGLPSDGFWPATSRIIPACQETFHFQKHLLRVAGADLRLEPAGIAITDIGGPQAGIWEPGDTLQIVVQPRNGGTMADVVTVRVESSSPWVQVVNGTAVLGAVPGFSTGSNAGAPLTVLVSPAAPTNAAIAFHVFAEAPSSLPARVCVTQAAGLPPLTIVESGFETGAGGWTVGAPGDNATGGFWTLDDPIGTSTSIQAFNPEEDHTPAPGVACWFTGQGVPGGPVGAADVDGITTLVSPVFDLAHVQDPVVSYWRWFSTAEHDTLTVEMSNDGGATWTPLESVTGAQAAWTQRQFRIEEYRPRTSAMRFRFRAADANSNSWCEAGLDDFAIQGFVPALDLSIGGSAIPGGTLTVGVSAPAWPGAIHLLGCSATALYGIPTPAGLVPLDQDWLFLALPTAPGIFSGFLGILDGQGLAQAQIHIPNDPVLSTFSFVTAGVVGSTSVLHAVSGGLRTTIN